MRCKHRVNVSVTGFDTFPVDLVRGALCSYEFKETGKGIYNRAFV
jgi:hypothetical protein